MADRACALAKQRVNKLGIKQILRFILLMVCTIIVVIQLSECFYKLKYPPVSTHTKAFFNDSLYYPALTLCRVPAYKANKLKEYNLGNDVGYTSVWKKFPNQTKTLQDFWDEATYNLSEITAAYAIYKEKKYVSIAESIHFYNGRCFTFTPLIAMPTTGEEFGYRILLNRKVDLDSTKKKNGWNIYIHEIGEQWTELSRASNRQEGVFLGLKEELDIKITARQYSLLNDNNNPCEDDYAYDINKCEEKCLTERLIATVNCSAPWLPHAQHLHQCSTIEEIYNITKNYINNDFKQIGLINLIKNEENEIKSENEYVCSCSRNCRITLYSVEIDSRITLENSENSANSFVKIFFSSNMITTIEEQRGYDWSLFISDLGGSLGFLLGLSVLGIVGIFERIIELCCCVVLFSEEPIIESKPKPPRINQKISIFDLHEDSYYNPK